MTRPESNTALLIGKVLDAIARLSMFLACLSLATLTALFVAIILLRFAGVSIPSADEIAGILLGGTLALGFASVVPRDQHIAVDFFVEKMGPAGSALLRVLASVVMIAIIFYLLMGFSRMWYAAWLSGITMLGHLPIPRWVPMGVVLFGLIMLEIALILRFLQRLLSEGFGPPKHDILEGEH
jgi:TRAP-type C4-dicarboxylate transport system permease small subunit